MKQSHKLSEVISIVSHQFKTPLSAIKGYLEVLLSQDLGRINLEQKEYLEDAMENTIRMIELVKDLLDISQIEQGKLDFKIQPSNLEEIVKRVIKNFSSFFRARNCEVFFKVLNKLPLINIDPLKIEQVVYNLISNAIRYSGIKGRVEITLGRKQDNVYFCCKDNGIGILQEDRKKIFTKFYRSERAITFSPGGSGLGLFISKAIIQKSKGRIWFKSKENQGSVFCFSLPLKAYEKK